VSDFRGLSLMIQPYRGCTIALYDMMRQMPAFPAYAALLRHNMQFSWNAGNF
jgi:hypothetical protein